MLNSSDGISVQVVAVVLAPPALCVHKTVLWEPTRTWIADCDIPQMHYLCAHMIHNLTNDLVHDQATLCGCAQQKKSRHFLGCALLNL